MLWDVRDRRTDSCCLRSQHGSSGKTRAEDKATTRLLGHDASNCNGTAA